MISPRLGESVCNSSRFYGLFDLLGLGCLQELDLALLYLFVGLVGVEVAGLVMTCPP